MTPESGGRGGPRGGRNRRDSEPQRLSASLREAARLIGAGAALDLATIEKNWPTVVGEHLAGHCWPVSLERGVLVVSSDHNAWAAELRFHSAAVIARAASLVPGVVSLAVRVEPSRSKIW
jgi:predicted nucleic acid-binding Zn ribbon protein